MAHNNSGMGWSGIVSIPIPPDGATGQVLTKQSPDDYDTDWAAGGGGGGLPPDADYGDITVSGVGTVWTIDNDVVTFAKMQNSTAADVLIGRGNGGGAGNFQEITLGTNLSLTGTVLNATGSGVADADYGDITVSGAGTIWTIDNDVVTNAKLANMAANTIKGNDTAGATDPTDIAVGTNTVLGRVAGNIVAAQLDTAQITDDAVTYAKMQNVSAASRLLGRGSAGGAGNPEELTLGTNLSLSGTVLNATGGGGSGASTGLLVAAVYGTLRR